MVECSNCGLMINKNDKKCPRCGHVFDVKKKEKEILTGVGVAAVGAGVIGAGIASHEKENKSAIENLKNNTISKKTEKIEKVETAKKADAKDIVESSSKKQTETQKTAYESKKYNDSLEIDKTKESTTKENAPAEKGQKTTEEDNAQKETDNHEEIAKTDNTDDIEIDENESVSEEIKTLLEKISKEQDNNEEIEALISMLTENQDSDEELEDLLRKLSEGETDDETLEALIKMLEEDQKNINDQVDNDLEEDMSMSESTSGGGSGGGDSVDISFYQLENALSILGCATSTSLPNSANGENFDITSCKTKGPAGGLANVFTKIDSEEYNKLNNKEGHNQYKKTLSNFDGSETSFLPKMESKLLKLRQNLIDMMGEDYYKLSLGNEILGSCYDENGEIDMDQAKKLENLWNRLHDDDKKDISSMNGTSLKEFIDSFYANDSIQDYFQDFSKELTNYNDMDLVDSDYTQTEIYKRKADKGIILTEEEVREYCERYGDSVAAVLISNISLGRITDDGSKTLTDYVNMNYQNGLYGYDINDNGEEEGKEKASYNQKTKEQEILEQMFWDYLTKTGRNDENKDHYDKMDKYIEDYGNEIGDTSKISTSNQYYILCQTGFLNSAYTKDGARRYGREYLTEAEFNNDSEAKEKYDSYEKYYEENGGSHYIDSDTNKTVFVPYRNAEEQKNYDRYMDIVKSRGNSSNRFIYGSVFEEVCDAQDEYYEHSLPEYEEIAAENLNLIVYDENNNPIGVKNNGDDSTIDDYYERANSAVEKYRESLDRIKLLETFVNQKQITESITSANSKNREYSEEDFPPGVKEYLGFLDSKDKRKYMYQYVEKSSLPYADTAKAYGNSIGSKVQTTLDILKEMYGEEEGYIRAEGLKETIIDNDNVYRSLIEQNNNVHDQNLGILFNIAQRIATEKREEYDRKNNNNSAVVSAGYWPTQNEIDKENELRKEAESAEAEASRLANKMATSKILSNESKSIYEAGLYEIIKSKPVTERTTAENDFFLEYRAKNQTDIKEYNENIDNLYETLSKCNNFKEVCDIINNIGTINIEIENFIGNYKIRSQPDFEEKNKSKIFSLERIEEVDDGGSTTIYINALDENGNKLDVSEEEIEIYLAGIAKGNGGKLPLKYRMCYTKSSNQVDRINYLAKTDLEVLTYKANTLDYNTFKFDYKSYVEFGALCKATEQYEKYVDILERGNDVEDWFVTVGYGAWAGGAQFVDGFKNLIDPDGLKNENDYRTMLISSYLLNEYGPGVLGIKSNYMLGTYEVTTSIVNMLPTIILSCIPVVGQGLGLATMFLSTAGNATEQGLQSGMTLEQARLYGIINGALETGLQATVGGISKLTIGKLPVAKLITEKLGAKLAEGTLRTAATNYLLNILSEGLEEGTQEILDPIIQRLFAASENNFIEMKESLSNLTLTEWQEEKFLEWKSNSLSGISNKEEYLNIYNTKFEDWLATSGIDEAMFDKIKSKEYTYEKWKEDNKLETSASALWGTIDWTAVKKSALYGAISGGIIEGVTQFVPEVISFVRTGSTLGIPAIMNSVRNQAKASGKPKNIFQILAETNQIIKEQSKTGKLGELVSEYMETESFKSDYENFMNEIKQSSKEQTETNAPKSKLSNILKSIKEKLGFENEMSEVNFATMQIAGSLVANAPLARISNILRDTNYKSYKEYLDRLSELNESETRLTEEIKQLKADNSDINSEINKDNLSKKQEELAEIQSEKNSIKEAIEYYKKSTGTLRSDLASEALELLENIRNDEATLKELQQTLAEVENSLNNEIDSTSVKELKNRIKGLKEKLENQRKSKKGITKTAERILLQNIEQYQNALKNLQKNELKGKENKIQQLKESINELTENINSSKARATEIDSILEILLNPESKISSLTSEQFNNFVSELDLRSLQIYSKDIFARLSEISDVSIENLLSRLDVITLGVFETEIVERIGKIKSNEILNRIKDKYGLRFTKDIYKIEADTTTSDTTTSQTEAIAENTNSDNNTSQNTINNSQTETITRETTKARKDAPKTEVKKEIISQNAALGVVGIIQMTVIPGLKGNQTLNNVLETIQTDISSLELRRENLNNENSNVDTENNTTEEIESNTNIREELESQIEQKKKLYDDLTQLMSKYGVDGSKLLTSLKEKIISGRYKLEQQLLNVKTVIEEITVDSITESENAIKELLKKYDLANADQSTLNKVKTEIMYKILEIANKNNISVYSILSKINIDEMLVKNDTQIEFDNTIEGLSDIIEDTDFTEEDFEFLESKTSKKDVENYLALMRAIKNIRRNPENKNIEDYETIKNVYNEIKNYEMIKSYYNWAKANLPSRLEEQPELLCATYYISELNKILYNRNLLAKYTIDGVVFNVYGKASEAYSNLIKTSLLEFEKYLKKMPAFMKTTIGEINLYNYDSYSSLYSSIQYYNDITYQFNSAANTTGSAINFWKIGLPPSITTFFHEVAHNVDTALGKYEGVEGFWTRTTSLWSKAKEKDGGAAHVIREYCNTFLSEDFAESFAHYLAYPEWFAKEFPNRTKIIENILEYYNEVIDCSYDNAMDKKEEFYDNAAKVLNAIRKTVPDLNERSTVKDVIENIESNIRHLNEQIVSSNNVNIEELTLKIKLLEELENNFKEIVKAINAKEMVPLDYIEYNMIKPNLEEWLSFKKEIEETKHQFEERIRKIVNNESSETLDEINEIFNKKNEEIAKKYKKSIEYIERKINLTKILSKIFDASQDTATIAPMVENTFDNNINGNTNNNVETRNTTEGVKTIKSLDQIIDEDIRSKLVEAIKKNQESSKKLEEKNTSGAIAALSWNEINEILKSSPNSKVVNELCKVWSTNAISPFMLIFNYEQTIEIVNELKNGISIETLRELGIERILDGNTTIEQLYKDRAYAIIEEALKGKPFTNSEGNNIKIDIEFAKMIIKGNQQVIKYKKDSKYQNNFIKNLTKFSPKQLEEINNLFKVISGFEVCESVIDYNGKIEDFGRRILDAIYKINEIYEEEVKNGNEANKINLNIEIINELLKVAPKLSSLSDCNSMISSLISGYFYHDGKYLFNNQKYYNDLISAIQKSIEVSGKKSKLVSEIIDIIKNPKTTDVVSEVILAIETKLENDSDLNLDKKDKSGKKTNENEKFVKRIKKIMKSYKKDSNNVELISSLVTEIETSLGTDTIALKEIMDKTNSLMSEIKNAIKNTENKNSIEFISKIEEIIKSLPNNTELSLKISEIIKSTTDITDLITKVSNEISASLKSDYIKSIKVEMNELNSYAEEILSTLLNETVNEEYVLSKIINITEDKIEINADFVETIKNKLNTYETRIVYNYLEGKVKSALNIDQQVKIFENIVSIDSKIKEVLETENITKADAKTKIKEILKSIPNNETLISNIESIIDNSLSIKDTLLKIIGEVQTTMGYTTTTAIISKNAELASRFRNVLRESMQDAGFGISVLPKAGTNKLNSTYAGAVINYLMKYKFDGLENSLKFQIIEIMGAYPGGEDLSTYSSKEILKWLENLSTENINDIYEDLLKEQLSETILRSEIGIYDNAFKSNDFVNIAVGITNMNKAQFLEKIKSWEEKLATNGRNLKGYNLLDRYNYFKYVTEKIGESIEKFKTIINWPVFGGYKGLPNLFEKFFTNVMGEIDVEGEFIISRYGSENSNNATIGRPGEEIPGTSARGIPVKDGIYYTAKIDLAKYKKLCDLMLNSLNDLNILNETNISELLNYINTPKSKRTSIEKNVDIKGFVDKFNKLIRENSNVVELLQMITNNEHLTAESISSKISDILTTDIKNMTEEDINNLKAKLYEINLLMKYFSNYSYSKNKSRTLQDFRKVSEQMIERCLNTYFQDTTLSYDEKIAKIKERFKEFNITKYSDAQIELYLQLKDPNIIKEIAKENVNNVEIKYGMAGYVESFGDLVGGAQQTTLMFSFADLETCGIIKEKLYDFIKMKSASYEATRIAREKLKTSFENTMNNETNKSLAKAIENVGKLTIDEVNWLIINRNSLQLSEDVSNFVETALDFCKTIQTSEMSDIIKYIGNLSISDIDNLIQARTYIPELGEAGKFMKTAMQIYQQGLEAASTKYKEFYQNFRDHGFKHALEVTKYALELSKKLKLSNSEIELVAYSALAHDFGMQGGKVYINDGLLTKFAKSYIKYIGEKVTPELTNKYKMMFEEKLITNNKAKNNETGKIWDIDGLQKYLKETYGEFISDKDFIMNVARSSHPLNSALDILANNDMIPATLQKNIAKEFGEENAETVATSLIALLAMSHSKSTSGIKLMDQSQMWIDCIEKLRLSAKARGVEENLNVDALKRIIRNPELFEKLQDMAILVRDGDAMSKVVSEDGTTRTVMQNGENAVLDLSDVKGENLFHEDGTLISEEEEHSRIKEETTNGRKLNNKDDSYSKGIHAGELNTEYSSNYTKENGKKKYTATVTVKDSSLVPHSTLGQSILERLGELNTYTNMDERLFIIYLSTETDPRIIKLYEEVINEWKIKAKSVTEDALSAIGIQKGTQEYKDIMDRQVAFYENIQIIYK